MPPILYSLAADLTVVVHLGYVLFVILGLLLVLVGWAAGWKWVRNFWFRAVHFVAILIVVVEALFGVTCPLTIWEKELRIKAGDATYQGDFMGKLAHELLFYDGPKWVFTVCYVLFGLAVLAAMIFVRPRWPWSRAASAPASSPPESPPQAPGLKPLP